MCIETTESNEPFRTTHRWLRAFNEQFVGPSWIPVRLVARDDDGTLVGSLDGEMQWGKLHVDNLVVREDQRGRGVGRALMAEAERMARENGCSGAHLATMSFQALDFYERLGYANVGEIPGFEGGAIQYFLHKTL